MPWLELRIDSSREAAPELEAQLLSLGALSVTLQDNADQPILEPAPGETPLWDNTRVVGMFAGDCDTEAIVQNLRLPEETAAVWQILEDRIWEREWMNHFSPLKCGEKLWICPSWTPPPEPESVNIMLDPGLAFGSGTHPTTFLCLNWLSKQNLSAKSIVDYGCGSGILAIACLLLGAKQATCVDIDPQALIATRENLKNNRLEHADVELCLPEEFNPPQADFVVANILAAPLIELAPKIASLVKPNGKLCLSGILATQAEMVSSAYANDFIFEPVLIREEWACLTASKHP